MKRTVLESTKQCNLMLVILKNYANNSYFNCNKWINNKFSDEGTDADDG